MVGIRIKYIGDSKVLEKLKTGDMIDLSASETVKLKKGEYKKIPLNVAMELPTGYEAHVYPRSSTFQRWGIMLVNGVGIIDESYCGDNDIWQFAAYAARDTVIEKGDRIAQFRIFKHQPEIKFFPVDRLGNDDRGGFGTTGAN